MTCLILLLGAIAMTRRRLLQVNSAHMFVPSADKTGLYIFWNVFWTINLLSFFFFFFHSCFVAETWTNHLMLTYDKLTVTNIQEGNFGTFICHVKDAIGTIKNKKQYRLFKLNGKSAIMWETCSIYLWYLPWHSLTYHIFTTEFNADVFQNKMEINVVKMQTLMLCVFSFTKKTKH